MTDRIEMLVIGRNPQIMQNVLRLVNSHPEWAAVGALTDEEAIEQFHHHHFDLVLIGGGVEAASEKKLHKIFRHQHPSVIILRHFGGGSELLFSEIEAALEVRSGIQITDNPFGNNSQ